MGVGGQEVGTDPLPGELPWAGTLLPPAQSGGAQGGAAWKPADRCGIRCIVLRLDAPLIFIGSNCTAGSVLPESLRPFSSCCWGATGAGSDGFTWDQMEMEQGLDELQGNLGRRLMRLIKMIT